MWNNDSLGAIAVTAGKCVRQIPGSRSTERTHPSRTLQERNVVSPTGSPSGVGQPQGRNNTQWVEDVSKSEGHLLRTRRESHNPVDKHCCATRKRADLRQGLNGTTG